MDLRNIRRAFVFSKALKKYNKHNGIHLQRTHVYVLYCLLMLGANDRYVSATTVRSTFYFVNLGNDYRAIVNNLVLLVERGYLTRNVVEGKTYWFKLTIEGLNLLNTFETCLRKERWNR